VDALPGVFFQMNAIQMYAPFSIGHADIHITSLTYGICVLGNLISLRQIRIEIIFPGEIIPGFDF
jgi:hypothetical protein